MLPEYGHHSVKPASKLPGSAKLLVCAVGDVHGSLRKLRALIARCKQYAEERPLKYVFLGDYIDRGPESAGVVHCLIELQSRLPECVLALKGNHEGMLLDVIDRALPAEFWLSQGGAATLRSYGAPTAWDLPSAHVDWLRSLPSSYDDGQRFFVHAGIDPDVPLADQREQDLLWIREPFLSDRRNHGRLIVHGHTPLANGAPDPHYNRLNLDTAAVFGGPLTAAIFAGSAVGPSEFLQVW